MRKILFIAVLMLIVSTAQSAIYYVSDSDGLDTDSGLTEALAWKTLDKVNAYYVSPGFSPDDQILFKKGDTFYGSLTITSSGTAGHPVILGAYGTGVNPIITGFTTVSAWTNLGSNIWESTSAVSTLSTCNAVSVNGVNTGMGRLPQSGYYTFQSHLGRTSVTSSSLDGVTDWTGAEIVVRVVAYIANRVTVTSQTSTTLNFSPETSYDLHDGYGFFIQNDVRTLTYQNAWYYNPSTKKIRMYSTTEPSNVKVASADTLVTVHGSYNTLENITFTGSNSDIIYNQGSEDILRNLVVRNCSISFAGASAMKLKMQYLTVDGNVISDNQNSGIMLTTQVATDSVYIRNNTITNSGMILGMAVNAFAGGGNGILLSNKNNVIVEYNHVINTGYNGIAMDGSNGLIKNNLVDNYNVVLDDGGGIYSYGGSYNIFTGNIVVNSAGAADGTNSAQSTPCGIYLDYGTNNTEVSYNTTANSAYYGMFTHASDINVHHNTVYNNTLAQYNQSDWVGGIDNVNNLTNNNIFISKTATQYTIEFDYPIDHPQSIGTLDNNYYARPIADNSTIRVWPIGGSATNYTLAGWQALMGQDTNSKKSPYIIISEDELIFVYNVNTIAKSVSIPFPAKELNGTVHYSSITLLPFSSAVLFRDDSIPNPAWRRATYNPRTGKIYPFHNTRNN